MPTHPHDQTLKRICQFLDDIGIPTKQRELPGDTFLPGIRIEYGALAVDRNRLMHVGDILHEAGHIACMAPAQREQTFSDAGNEQGEEIAAQAWSYAAAVACGIPPSLVFHEAGYRGSAQNLIDMYESGGTNGVPLLEWFDLTSMPSEQSTQETCFPQMHAWLRSMDDPAAYWQKRNT